MKRIRTYSVSVQGFPPHLYSARSPGKARASAWNAYRSYDNDSTFKDFMRISVVRRAPDPPGIGERILVAGLEATRCIGWGQYTSFMRDDSDTILLAHPLEVQPIKAPDAETGAP